MCKIKLYFTVLLFFFYLKKKLQNMAAQLLWRYLTREEIIALNRETDGRGIIMNESNLQNAVTLPGFGFGGHDANPTVEEKVFVLARAISQGHPFQDGNKRTATNAVRLFLRHNDLMFQEREEQPTLQQLVNRLVDENPISKRDFINAIQNRIGPFIMKLLNNQE